MRPRLPLLAALAAALPACSSSDGGAASVTPPPYGGDTSPYLTPPKSCAFDCPATSCAEETTPYACPAMDAWNVMAHDETCPAWDGTFPAPTATQCKVSAPSGDAVKPAGPDPDDPTVTILPDGRRIHAAGAEWLFDEPDLPAGSPQAIVPIPGTSDVLVLDVGYGPHAVRLVDTAKVGSGTSPVLSYVKFDAPSTLNANAAFVPPDLALVATDDGHVQALTVDTTNGTLAKDDTRSLALPQSIDDQGHDAPYYVAGLAASPDGKRLLVTSVFDKRALVFDLDAASYGTKLGEVALPKGGTFQAAFDPHDPSGSFAYATMWGGRALVEIDLTNPAAPALARSFPIVKDPQGFAFLDARFIAVANDYGDRIALVDRVAGTVTEVPVDVATSLYGAEPSTVAYDEPRKRLYATLAGANALGAWDVDTATTPPTLTPAGRLPTSWWPSSVAALEDGSLAILTMRGHSNGALAEPFAPNSGDAMQGVRGGMQLVPPPSAADLSAGEQAVKTHDDVGALAGAPIVTCPEGVSDFPVPATNTEGPSKRIQHVFFILRENKTFDALLGDLPGVDGDPSLTLKASSDDMDRIWKNFRALVRTFATSDDYYTDAELSDQGHTWATYGRSNDFAERTWSYSGGYTRNAWTGPVQPQGTADIGQPLEGSVFDWLLDNHVSLGVFGEAEGQPQPHPDVGSPVDAHYPGGFIQSMGHPDNEKACYLAARIRAFCNIGQFSFVTFPNDHTQGVSSGAPSPEVMMAVNDEATGMFVDALSHSPIWSSSLVIVTEDDPAGGGDHVEHHRTPILFASPWIKRGYVSKTHMDVSSLYKLVAHIFGIPYPNDLVAHASLPTDLFSDTPDYGSYDHAPRDWPLSCGTAPTRTEQRIADSWDFDDVDEQPGLDAQVWRVMRGQPLRDMPPELERDVVLRETRRRVRLDAQAGR